MPVAGCHASFDYTLKPVEKPVQGGATAERRTFYTYFKYILIVHCKICCSGFVSPFIGKPVYKSDGLFIRAFD